ncbi:MAG TPA: hypothetical protein VKG79_12025 [Bryobacteraceae bacterium]|nr:hypothetical protein [Bryobacteraceae bacterium]
MSDLRVSIGGFFTLVGAIVTATGFLSVERAPLDTANVDLYAGAAMLAFGLVMLWIARRRS